MGGNERASLASLLPPTIKGALTEERFPSPATLSPETNLHLFYMTTTREVLFLYSNHRSSTNHTPSSLINRSYNPAQHPVLAYSLRPAMPIHPTTHQRHPTIFTPNQPSTLPYHPPYICSLTTLPPSPSPGIPCNRPTIFPNNWQPHSHFPPDRSSPHIPPSVTLPSSHLSYGSKYT